MRAQNIPFLYLAVCTMAAKVRCCPHTPDFTALGTFTRRPYLSLAVPPECPPTPKGQLNPVSAPNLGLQRGQNLLMYQENTELQANIFAFEHNRFAQYLTWRASMNKVL